MEKLRTFYIIGIGGISLSAIAYLLKEKGFIVLGSDATSSTLTDKLKSDGFEVEIGNKSEFVERCDAVIISGAIGEDDSDLIYAKKLGKPIFTRAEILGKLTKDYKLISVAGSHGKTTTTGMISSMLLSANLDPTIHIGGILNNIHSNLKIGKSEYFITEACEYKDSFLSLSNYMAVVLNIQEDHLDYFKNLDNIFVSFNKFIENTDKKGLIIYNYDEYDIRLKLPQNVISFGFDEHADVRAENIFEHSDGKYQFDLIYKNQFLTTIKLPCFGKHNVLNALAASACGLFLGLDKNSIKQGIESFKGIERRFEEIREEGGHLIIHDYAHHPTEISASLKACREIKKEGKIIAVFQPHTFTRTRDLFKEFVHCFNDCDEVWLIPIYPAREKPIEGITSKALSLAIENSGKKTRYFDNFEDCKNEILREFENTDLFAILGAGDIEKLAYSLRK